MEKKSPRSFVDGGIGLGIVAAMTDSSDRHGGARGDWTKFSSHPAAVSLRSSPIPIVSLAKPAAANFNWGGVGLPRYGVEKEGSGDGGSASVVDESDEVYTCVVSHVGNEVIKKFVYYDDKVSGFRDDATVTVFDVNPAAAAGMFYASSSPLVMTTSFGGGEGWRNNGFCNQDFLASCNLCNKLLHGLDIFMYRGEKAFCSAECREKHMRNENYREKYGRARGDFRKQPHECSLSPCSSPQVYLAEVAAA